MYCILPTKTQLLQRSDDSTGHVLNLSLIHSLLSVAIELHHSSLPASEQELAQSNKEWLRTRSLEHIPNLCTPYEPYISDAISLLLMSFTWCFQRELCDTSLRWNALARVIVLDAARNREATHPEIGQFTVDLER